MVEYLGNMSAKKTEYDRVELLHEEWERIIEALHFVPNYDRQIADLQLKISRQISKARRWT